MSYFPWYNAFHDSWQCHWAREKHHWLFAFTDLAQGMSASWTELFIIDLGGSGAITWTATAEAEFDVNPVNDSVTSITTVKNSTGGGGH